MVNKNFNLISPTAKIVAYLRGFAKIPFSREFAKYSNAEETLKKIGGKNFESLINSAPIVEARYKSINKALSRVRIKQILELAAGISPRGLELTKNQNIIYVETDLPKILKEKKKIVSLILNSLGKKRKNLHFISVDALKRKQLIKSLVPFKKSPVAIISEGLLPYFNHKEKVMLTKNIYDVLSRYGGVWIVTDIVTKKIHDDLRTNNEFGNVAKRILKFTRRNMEANTFKDESEAIEFFEKAGFKVKFKLSHEEIVPKLSSLKKLKLSRGGTRELLKGRFTWVFEL